MLKDPSVSPEQAAKISGVGLSESPHGLQTSQAKSLIAVAGQSVDPSQCGTILRVTIEETAADVVQKRCGKTMQALSKEVEAAAENARAKLVSTTCKIDPPSGGVNGLDPWGMLMSAVIGDQMKADPKSNPEEQELARKLVRLCVPEQP